MIFPRETGMDSRGTVMALFEFPRLVKPLKRVKMFHQPHTGSLPIARSLDAG